MPRTGGHDYHMLQHKNEKFKLTLGDCEYNESRRFINSLTDSNINQLFNSILVNIWDCNRYGVQSKTYDTYLLGQESTQEFINITSPNCTFWGLVPFQLVCVATVSFHPYNCGDCRWNVQVDFGSANEFRFLNHDPHSVNNNNPAPQFNQHQFR